MTLPTPPLESLLVQYLPSELGRAEAALVDSGVAEEEIRATLDAVAAIGLAAAPEAPPSPSRSIRERLVATERRVGKYGRFTDRVARLFDIDASAAEALLQRIESPDAWSDALLEGVYVLAVNAGPSRRQCTATLVKIESGASFPFHRHHGEETMLMLEGGFRDPNAEGHEAWHADELIQSDGSGHALQAIGNTPCVAAILIEGTPEFGVR
jgi:quercetin dioxygenase-like cupin family protein